LGVYSIVVKHFKKLINQIDIPKSKQAEKLVFKRWILERIAEYFLYGMFVIAFPFISFMEFNSDLTKNEPIGISLTFFTLSLILSSLLIYSILNLNTLKRVKGISRGQNTNLIKKIAEKNNWNIYSSNQQMTILNLNWKESSGFDWGKQLTIIYDGTDLLVNCISFGLHSSPSPFHWFANKRKINKLKTEFESGIKNVLQQRV
tara:strand:+ start:442 stop:1050 length:609 start_codon:yes stop_codon:yes gene_type:complete